MLKKRPKKPFFWLLRGILGPNRHQKVFKRPITHLKTSQEFKFPIKNLPRWLLLPQKCKKWWYAIRAPCVRRPKTIKIKNFKKSSKNFLFFGVFQLNIHPLWGSKAQSWTSFKLNLMSARDPQCIRHKAGQQILPVQGPPCNFQIMPSNGRVAICGGEERIN